MEGIEGDDLQMLRQHHLLQLLTIIKGISTQLFNGGWENCLSQCRIPEVTFSYASQTFGKIQAVEAPIASYGIVGNLGCPHRQGEGAVYDGRGMDIEQCQSVIVLAGEHTVSCQLKRGMPFGNEDVLQTVTMFHGIAHHLSKALGKRDSLQFRTLAESIDTQSHHPFGNDGLFYRTAFESPRSYLLDPLR